MLPFYDIPVEDPLLVNGARSLPKDPEISGVETFHGAILNLLNA